MKVELSVIIVNYNGYKYLKDCLDSLFINLEGIAFEIIVIDNNSQDESCSFLKMNYPEVVLIESSINFGFGRGNNEAVKKAKGDHLLLINNDTIVVDHLKPVLEILKSDESIGAIGINMLDADKKYLPAAANFPNYKNVFRIKKIFDKGQEFKTGNFVHERYDVDWLGGSFLLLPSELYREINGFDEDYFMYVEDVDFCKKIAEKHYKRVFLPNYSYIHFVGYNASKDPFIIKGLEIYISKHFKGFSKKIMTMALSTNKLVKYIKNLLKTV